MGRQEEEHEDFGWITGGNVEPETKPVDKMHTAMRTPFTADMHGEFAYHATWLPDVPNMPNPSGAALTDELNKGRGLIPGGKKRKGK